MKIILTIEIKKINGALVTIDKFDKKVMLSLRAFTENLCKYLKEYLKKSKIDCLILYEIEIKDNKKE